MDTVLPEQGKKMLNPKGYNLFHVILQESGHTHIHTYIRTYTIHTHPHTYAHTNAQTYTHICIYLYSHTRTHICTRVHALLHLKYIQITLKIKN